MKQLVARAGGKASAATPADVARDNEVLLLSTPWPAAREVLASLGDFTGKTLIDLTNALQPNLQGLELANTTSAGEKVAAWAAGAKVVKAFNTVGFNIMENPAFGSDKAVMFYCGDDPGAKETVRQLTEELGFDAVEAGPLKQARVLEPFALLWISLAYGCGYGREIAFKLLKR